jgi:hypothetical protein
MTRCITGNKIARPGGIRISNRRAASEQYSTKVSIVTPMQIGHLLRVLFVIDTFCTVNARACLIFLSGSPKDFA